MFARVKKYLKGFQRSDNGSEKLPANFNDALASRQSESLQSVVSEVFTKKLDEIALDSIFREIERLQWPVLEKTKFYCWSNFHRGRLYDAYRYAFDYLQSGAEFNADIYMHGCLAAYHANHFEDARSIYLYGETHQVDLVEKNEYFLVSALIYWAVGEHVDAVKHILKAENLNPDNLVILGNLLNISFECGMTDTWQSTYAKLLSRVDSMPETSFALAFCDLAEGRYRQGFERMESRYDMLEMSKHIGPSLRKIGRCNNINDFKNRRILITAEQGLGDTVMLSRYFHLIENNSDITLECQSEVLPLIAYNFPWLKIVELNYGTARVGFDACVATMSLPFLFETDIDSVPASEGYLTVPPDSLAYWGTRVAECASGNKLKVGLTWSGSPTHRADRRRSIPFSLLAQYLPKIDADYFVLQTVVPADLPESCINMSDEMLTLADTAALIKHLDVVVTIDTSVVHVAGAIGHHTILLLPRRYEWRWQLEGPTNPWYDSVEVVRQQENGAWEAVLEEVFSNKLPALLQRKRDVENV